MVVGDPLATGHPHSTTYQGCFGDRYEASIPTDAPHLADVPGRGDGTGSGGLGQPETRSAGQADGDEWLVLVGEVTDVTPEALTVTAADGAFILVAGRAWLALQEQGFASNAGHTISATGFYAQDRFEIGTVTNRTTGVAGQVRDASGRPMWAGRGGGARDN